jgi:hypothetical protein
MKTKNRPLVRCVGAPTQEVEIGRLWTAQEKVSKTSIPKTARQGGSRLLSQLLWRQR